MCRRVSQVQFNSANMYVSNETGESLKQTIQFAFFYAVVSTVSMYLIRNNGNNEARVKMTVMELLPTDIKPLLTEQRTVASAER